MEKLELKVGPGTVVLFNGDKLWHAVTPTAEGERRCRSVRGERRQGPRSGRVHQRALQRERRCSVPAVEPGQQALPMPQRPIRDRR